MFQVVVITFLVGLLCPLTLAQVQFAGFFDLQLGYDLQQGRGFGIDYGQFELDPLIEIAPGISVEAALAFNPEERKIELGAGFMDFHFNDERARHPVRGFFLAHSGLMIGQFDVPFGLDYQFIPSPERKLITPPLVNQKTIDSWNDMGINFYGAGSRLSYSFFLLNGFYDNFALGGRILFHPLKFVTIGGSHASDRKSLSRENAHVSGVELSVETEKTILKGEYLRSYNIMDGTSTDSTVNTRGFYVQVIQYINIAGIKPLFFSLRYGKWGTDEEQDGNGQNETLGRLTLGAGMVIQDGVEIRLEYLNQLNQNKMVESLTTVQTVVSF